MHRESFYALANSLFPGHMVRKLERTWGKVAKTPIEWAGTRAVFIPIFEFVGGIQIMGQDDAHELGGNHLGDYENFREYLIQQLLELRDPQTNRPIVLEAYRREELYKGVYTHDAPDIIFVMDTDYRGDKGLLSKSLVSEKLKDISLWTGTHRREGIVVLSGPSITPGKISNTPQILDLTPTILYLLGLAIPEDMDGKVIEEAIESVYLAQNKIEFTKPMSSSKEISEAETAGFSDDEMEKVRKQLEGLGYLS